MNHNIIYFIDPVTPITSEGTTNETWKEIFTKATISINLVKIPDEFEFSPLNLKIRRMLCTKVEFFHIFHRKNGPAIEYTNGNKYWYKNGKWHRGRWSCYRKFKWL